MLQKINAFEKNNISSNESKVIERTSLPEVDDEISCPTSVYQWQVNDVLAWAKNTGRCSDSVIKCLCQEGIDGEVLMALTEEDVRDFRYKFCYNDLSFSDLKKLWLAVQMLQLQHGQPRDIVMSANFDKTDSVVNRLTELNTPSLHNRTSSYTYGIDRMMNGSSFEESISTKYGREINRIMRNNNINPNEDEAISSISTEGKTVNIPPEFFKTAISLGYSFLVTWITSFVMVIVHERVPDMKRYPPLPDIFLDNVPHIPWAFHMCEITGTLLFSIWSCVCIFHRYRMVLLRRFFALAGTVFLLRCVTMLITSLSVPGTHLQCNQNDYAVDDTRLTITEALELRISRAYTIWSGLGMSIQGVRTCGDYMFSGHTVALTLLNFFITEYTPRNLYFLHTLTWLLNMFGIFFILAAHEHYSIDVFVAFYITSRLFLYYHTLANNQALMSRDSNRTRIWFPMFSYFESSVNGIIPNEYDSLGTLLENIFNIIISVKDLCMLTARRFWAESSVNFVETTKKTFFSTAHSAKHENAPTSTRTTTNKGLTSPASECNSSKEINTFISGNAMDLINENKTIGQTRNNKQSVKMPTPPVNASVKKCI